MVQTCVLLLLMPLHASGPTSDVGCPYFFPLIVTFRMVVFRPFVSEVIIAKVKSSDEDGIRRMLVWLLTMSYLP